MSDQHIAGNLTVDGTITTAQGLNVTTLFANTVEGTLDFDSLTVANNISAGSFTTSGNVDVSGTGGNINVSSGANVNVTGDGDVFVLSRRVVTASQGTGFPANPRFGDECYRTDLDEWYKFNGTIWSQI